jgi:hypothetical protein
MPGVWKTWSAKTGKKFMNVPNIDGNVDDVAIAEVFRSKLI